MNVNLKLSVLKPIHATWLVKMSQYNSLFHQRTGEGSCLKMMGEGGDKWHIINWKGGINASVLFANEM